MVKVKIPEPHTWKARHRGSRDNRRIGLCARTSESTSFNEQKVHIPKYDGNIDAGARVLSRLVWP